MPQYENVLEVGKPAQAVSHKAKVFLANELIALCRHSGSCQDMLR